MQVGFPVSPNRGDVGKPDGVTGPYQRDAADLRKRLKKGMLGERDFYAILKRHLGFEAPIYLKLTTTVL